MLFKLKKSVSVEIEGDFPLLGYNVEEVMRRKREAGMNEAMREALEKGEGKHLIEVDGIKYEVQVETKFGSAKMIDGD